MKIRIPEATQEEVEELPSLARTFSSSYDAVYMLSKDRQNPVCLVSNNFSGIHEIRPFGERLIVSSTAINGVVLYDIATQTTVNSFWPAEVESIRKRYSLQVPILDKTADNRFVFLDDRLRKSTGHLHLNAADHNGTSFYGLFNKVGAVCNLDTNAIVVEDQLLKGSHNLRFIDGQRAWVVSTRKGLLLEVNVRDGGIKTLVDLNELPISEEIYRAWRRDSFLRSIRGFVNSADRIAAPLFWRGLDFTDELVAIGTSPATIVLLQRNGMRYEGFFQYSRDVKCAVHGIAIVES